MADLELLELYVSPWSERARWALDWKGVRYARREYLPIADEEELRQKTGLSTVPVLFADGAVIGDSNAALEWLEEKIPEPALLPREPRARAQVRAWEIAASEAIAPAGRLVMITGLRKRGIEPLASHFASKYGWTEQRAAEGGRLVDGFLRDLTRAVAGSRYLVGEQFTRADLTVACMLGPLLGFPPDDLFEVDPGMRTMFGLPNKGDAALAPLHAWREAIYRAHRGRRVTPAVAA
jgi:glutathione S-transferase